MFFSNDEENKTDDNNVVHTLKWLKTNRRGQYNCSRKIKRTILKSRNKKIIIRAEEKSGKRVVKEITSLLMEDYTHIYITSLNRTDIHTQLDELLKYYNIKGYIVKNKKDGKKIIQFLSSCKKPIIVHYDESDYGSGVKQSMEVLYHYCMNVEGINLVCYSATPQEMVYGQVSNVDTITYTPCENYRGRQWFLDNKLVFEPHPFLDYTKSSYDVINKTGDLSITDHGLKLMTDGFIPGKKHFGILRITGNYNKVSKYSITKNLLTLYNNQIFKKYNVKFKFVDCVTHLKWDKVDSFNDIRPDIHTIYCVNQTMTRSTELDNYLKQRLTFYQDNRILDKSGKGTTNFSTLSQSIGRIKHYGPLDFTGKIYTDVRVFNLKNIGRMSGRVHTKKTDDHVEFKLIKLNTIGKRTVVKKRIEPVLTFINTLVSNNVLETNGYTVESILKNHIKNKIDLDGKYTSNMSGNMGKGVWTVDEIINNRRSGLGPTCGIRINICNDGSNNFFLIRWLVKDVHNMKYITKKSIHNS